MFSFQKIIGAPSGRSAHNRGSAPLHDMSDHRRRTLATLRPSGGRGSENAGANKRFSYAPGKKSLGGGRPSMGGPGAARRKSSIGRRSSMAAASRRSSVYGRGGKVKDPRPIGDKQFHQENIKRLITFLSSHAYDAPISVKILTSPTSHDFKRITYFIVSCLDPNFEFGDKFEDEFRALWKALGYPSNISRSSLVAPGSPVTWPALLAALAWLIEVVEYTEAEQKEEDCTSDIALPEDKLFFNYLTASYAEWLAGEDSTDAQDESLAALFERRDARITERCDALAGEVSRLDTDIATLKSSAGQLADLRARKSNMLSDQAKFERLVDKMQAHQATVAAQLEKSRRELAALEEEQAAHALEKEELERRVREQPFTPQEVQRMHQERKLREESLAQVRARKAEVEQKVWQLEMGIAKELQRLERAAHAFNDRASELLLIPATAKNNTDRVELEVSLNPNGTTSKEILGRDLQRAVKPALIRLREAQIDRLRQAQEEARESQERADTLRGLLAERRAEVEDMKVRVERAESHFVEERKNANAELEQLVDQVASTEREVQQLQTATSGALAASVKHVQQVEQEAAHFDDLSRSELAAINDEICNMMDAITSHKEAVTTALEEMLDRAEGIKQSVQ